MIIVAYDADVKAVAVVAVAAVVAVVAVVAAAADNADAADGERTLHHTHQVLPNSSGGLDSE